MAEEFRFVLEDVEKYHPDRSEAKDFTDYYLARNKRIRHYTKCPDKEGKTFLLEAEPGSLVKNHQELSEAVSQLLVKDTILMIKKEGVGMITVDDVKGYAERVTAYRDGETILDEVQIEFEVDQSLRPGLERILEPKKVINQGLFDYINEK